MITHYDLFAGIGGFSLSLEEVFTDEPIRHIFCEWESFPTAVLRQHWPDGEYWGDIADLVKQTNRKLTTNTGSKHVRGKFGSVAQEKQQDESRPKVSRQYRTATSDSSTGFTIVTGGFPCQPFSHAGRRKGTADDRYQWPNMYEVIRNTKPDWIIAENVRGLVTWNDGMVLEQVCADLESQGYEVQPLIIPAVAVNAPHRRDRVWIIAFNPEYTGQHGAKDGQSDTARNDSDTTRANQTEQSARPDVSGDTNADPGRQHGKQGAGSLLQPESQESEQKGRQHPDWSRNWQEVAFATCNDSVDDGLSRLVDGVPYSRAKWRKDSLKAYGNGIVSQVAVEIMKAIKTTLVKEVDNVE